MDETPEPRTRLRTVIVFSMLFAVLGAGQGAGVEAAPADGTHRTAGASAERGLHDQAVAVFGAKLGFGRELFAASRAGLCATRTGDGCTRP